MALAIGGVTQCMAVPNLPNAHLKKTGRLIFLGESVYVFGGVVVTPDLHSSDDVYAYDVRNRNWNQMPKMIEKRTDSGLIRLSENEVFITGTLLQKYVLAGKLRMAYLITPVFISVS